MKGHVHRRCPRPPGEACRQGRCQHSYAFTFSAGSDPVTGKRRQFTGAGYRTKRDVESALRKAISEAEQRRLQLRRGQLLDQQRAREPAGSGPTVAEFIEEWLARGVGTHGALWRPNTKDGYATNARLHVVPKIGELSLTEVTTRDLQRVLDEVAKPEPGTKKLRTKHTVARVRATITGAFKAARRLGLIEVNPATDLIITGSDSDHEITVYTPEQLGRLFTVLEEDRIGSLYYVDCFTGLRRGELVGLRRDDIDFAAGLVTVRHVITQRGSELRHGRPKSRRGERVVLLDTGTVEVLRAQLARQQDERHAWAEAYQDHGLVWSREDGTPLRPDDVTRYWHELTDRAGLPRGRLHDLRHTHASLALAAGIQTKIVSERLGHSSPAFTERVYQHTAPSVAAQAAESIAALTRGDTRAAASNSASNPRTDRSKRSLRSREKTI